MKEKLILDIRLFEEPTRNKPLPPYAGNIYEVHQDRFSHAKKRDIVLQTKGFRTCGLPY